MDLFTRSDLLALLEERHGPRVSLYIPTNRKGAEQDSVRFHNLVRQAEKRLVANGLHAPEASDFLAPLRSFQSDPTFWSNQGDGLAVFVGRDFLRVYRLPVAFREEVEVGGLFQITPLLPLLTGDGRFYVLALSQNHIRLFQGTRFTVHPVDLKGVPRSLAEALITHDRDEVLTFHTRPTTGGSWGAIFEGHGVGIDTEKKDLLLFFQRINRGLHELLRDERVPLILASVEYYMPIYREANAYPNLLGKGIVGSPDRLNEKELHDRAWALVEPYFQERRRRAMDRYHQAAGEGKATADAKEAISAAYRGEVETLFVAQGQHIWGTLDPSINRIETHERQQVGDEDLTNLAAIHTLLHGNTVFMLPAEEVPGGRPLAAVYHLPLPKRGKRP